MNRQLISTLMVAALTLPCTMSASIESPLPDCPEVEISVPLTDGDATCAIQAALDSASAIVARQPGCQVRISLSPGDYHISRSEATPVLYHISNTSSAEENPDQTKHIGLWLKGMSNVTVDGHGAWIVTHGEMTPLVIDSCTNVVLTGFTLTAADPTVPEITIREVDDRGFIADVTAPSQFVADDNGRFFWKGEGWTFGEEPDRAVLPEHAQVFYPERNVTRRVESPLRNRKRAQKIDDRTVRFDFDKVPPVHPGEVYQLRHGIRNEACALISRSRDVTIKDVEFNFLGNFGLVGQFSENLTYDNIRCRPRQESGRTDAGFADFIQMSGCRGKVIIRNSYFEGAHDDPVNIHGTHLKMMSLDDSGRHLKVRFMHPQTYGFQAFFEGDSVEVVNIHTLLPVVAAVVTEAVMTDEYTMSLTLDRPITALAGSDISKYAVENVTWTPEVEIRDNYFARTPTRGILITTRRKSVIEGNTFFRIPMSAILVSDDARSWYESGPVHDLTIRGNEFIECASPVICIHPEISRFEGAVHENIVIEGNRFIVSTPRDILLDADAADKVRFAGNVIQLPESFDQSDDQLSDMLKSSRIDGLTIRDNRFVISPR